MKKEVYACNVCGESEDNCSKLIGLKYGDDCRWEEVEVKDAETHICTDCFIEISQFWNGRGAPLAAG